MDADSAPTGTLPSPAAPISIDDFQHHVRNTLAIIRSLVRRSAHASDSIDQLVGALDGRIGALGRAQTHLSRNPASGADLEAIVCDELLAHQVHVRGGVTVSGPAVQLAWKPAVTLGLAFHELVTNAIRHGALSRAQGRLTIDWTLTPGDAGLLRIRWHEDFAEPAVAAAPRSGFGREFLEQTLAYELDAAVALDLRGDGLDCVITLPVESAVLQARR